MKLFNVYPRFDLELLKAEGVYLYDKHNRKYLDLYGGHGVISIGHSHLAYTTTLKQQMKKMVFYSNSVKLPLQERFAESLTAFSGYNDYTVFLCNSGAEAIENALKVASFHTGKGLMLGVGFDFPVKTIREKLLNQHHILTGSSANPNLLRILPPLSIKTEQISVFPAALKKVLPQRNKNHGFIENNLL